ncbi:hypothetical protein BTM25_45770 [Actinomadura rubteroloni]|uniref:Uncharacterized protein n=1 Tax=Actinomadura rubteroloni TaxID=1926885 RepID=A0A2P4UED1_9ACTN|nr:hypothetical protein BTM25_45770 [Actinomadura rubteroloni]
MLCLSCGRVRPALNRDDYTSERARLITQHGLCVCKPPQLPRDARRS